MNLEWNIPYKIIHNNYYPRDPKIIFKIPLINNRHVFMSTALNQDSQSFLVILDRQKFIHQWANSDDDSRFPGYHQGNEQLWRADRKFHDAENGFNQGESNPVPVSNGLACANYYPNCNLVFTDGVTRTIWLLANQALYIPVLTINSDCTRSFQENMGLNNRPTYSVQHIYEEWLKDNPDPYADKTWSSVELEL